MKKIIDVYATVDPIQAYLYGANTFLEAGNEQEAFKFCKMVTMIENATQQEKKPAYFQMYTMIFNGYNPNQGDGDEHDSEEDNFGILERYIVAYEYILADNNEICQKRADHFFATNNDKYVFLDDSDDPDWKAKNLGKFKEYYKNSQNPEIRNVIFTQLTHFFDYSQGRNSEQKRNKKNEVSSSHTFFRPRKNYYLLIIEPQTSFKQIESRNFNQRDNEPAYLYSSLPEAKKAHENQYTKQSAFIYEILSFELSKHEIKNPQQFRDTHQITAAFVYETSNGCWKVCEKNEKLLVETRALYEKKAKLKTNNEGETHLQLAIKEHRTTHYLSLLLILDELPEYLDPKTVNFEGQRALLEALFLWSICKGKIEKVKEILSKNEEKLILEATDSVGHGPVLSSIYAGQITMLKYLVEEKKLSLEVTDKYGRGPVLFSIKYGQIRMLKYLLDERELSLEVTNSYGYGPVLVSIYAGQITMLKYLLEEKKLSLEVTDSDGHGPVLVSIYAGQITMLKYLLDEKKLSLEVTDKYGRGPVLVSIYKGQIRMLKYLLDDKKLSLEVTNSSGSGPVLISIGAGQIRMLKYLVEEKKLSLGVKDNKGIGPLELAVSTRHMEIFNYLIELYLLSEETDLESLKHEIGSILAKSSPEKHNSVKKSFKSLLEHIEKNYAEKKFIRMMKKIIDVYATVDPIQAYLNGANTFLEAGNEQEAFKFCKMVTMRENATQQEKKPAYFQMYTMIFDGYNPNRGDGDEHDSEEDNFGILERYIVAYEYILADNNEIFQKKAGHFFATNNDKTVSLDDSDDPDWKAENLGKFKEYYKNSQNPEIRNVIFTQLTHFFDYSQGRNSEQKRNKKNEVSSRHTMFRPRKHYYLLTIERQTSFKQIESRNFNQRDNEPAYLYSSLPEAKKAHENQYTKQSAFIYEILSFELSKHEIKNPQQFRDTHQITAAFVYETSNGCWKAYEKNEKLLVENRWQSMKQK